MQCVRACALRAHLRNLELLTEIIDDIWRESSRHEHEVDLDLGVELVEDVHVAQQLGRDATLVLIHVDDADPSAVLREQTGAGRGAEWTRKKMA